MHKLGITGSIGSGKSTVCKMFKELGIPVFGSDDEGRRLLAEDQEVKEQVAALLGDGVLTDGNLDRKKIGAVVFSDPEKLKALNAIIHPRVYLSFEEWCSKQTTDWVIQESALLFETKAYLAVDTTLVVTAPEDVRIKRVMARDNATEDEVRARMKNQLSEEKKLEYADNVIVNDGEQDLGEQVKRLYEDMCAIHKFEDEI